MAVGVADIHEPLSAWSHGDHSPVSGAPCAGPVVPGRSVFGPYARASARRVLDGRVPHALLRGLTAGPGGAGTTVLPG